MTVYIMFSTIHVNKDSNILIVWCDLQNLPPEIKEQYNANFSTVINGII